MANKEDEFYSFDEALEQLRLKEEELKRLVSEGEIRAFRDGETMRLRVGDVESLRSELSGGEVVDLGAGEELVFEDDGELESAGLATEEISDMDTLLDDDVEDVGSVELEELEAGSGSDAIEAALDLPALDEPDLPARAALPEEEHESAGVRFLLIATAVLLTLAIPLCIAQATGNLSEVTRGVAFWKF